MKQITVLVFFLVFCTGPMVAQEKSIRKFYVGTFTSEGAEGIYLCSLNTETGDVKLEQTFKAVDNPSFLKLSADKKYLYVATRAPEVIEKSGGYVVACKVGEDGSIHFLNKQVSNGLDPCHVDVSPDGRFVAIATYGSGTTSLYPVNSDGSLRPASSVVINQGSGPNRERQSSPHAHSIMFSPFENKIFSADLGTDQLNIYTLENNELVQHGQKYVKLAPGAGPRHLDFHPSGEAIYVISELNSTITTLKKKDQRWDILGAQTTLPPGFSGTSYCADIHVLPNGRFVYGSNRGDNSIAIFAVESNSKRPIYVGTVLSEGNWPRNFAISPDSKFMLVANQRSGNITVFKIHPEAGVPEYTGMEIKLPSPVCIEFL